ncbi:MAG: hypothetical protein LBG44_01885 [Gemmatimonadota bacterium]|jgi:hypothetical protein|nr:hypothetical protein [Gemmatimonadota bacterium]
MRERREKRKNPGKTKKGESGKIDKKEGEVTENRGEERRNRKDTRKNKKRRALPITGPRIGSVENCIVFEARPP